MLYHKGTTELLTERLILRRFRKEDAEDMFNNWANDSKVTRCLSWKPHGDIDVTRGILSSWLDSYENDEFYNWAIELKKGNKLIGSIGLADHTNELLRCEVGYCIGKEFWNKGIMTEVLNRVIRYLFNDVGLNRIQAVHHADNPASGRVMVKAGMKYEGRLRHYHINNRGDFVDCEMYAVIKADVRDN